MSRAETAGVKWTNREVLKTGNCMAATASKITVNVKLRRLPLHPS